jgi:hypothetical protein
MSNEVTQQHIAEAEHLVRQAENELRRHKDTLSKLMDKLAQQLCPHKVGDIVEVAGYTHKGKKMLVKYIGAPKYTYHSQCWRVTGNIINKDGSVGLLTAEFDGGGK